MEGWKRNLNISELVYMVAIDCTSLVCFTYLASKFEKWWIILFVLLFFRAPT